jgi:signal transduction histidine kinase
VLSLLLRKRNVSTKSALRLLDDASAAIQYNREILQTALDHVRQGIAVFDREVSLVCWNRNFGEMLDLPPDLVRIGVSLNAILHWSAERGDFGEGEHGTLVSERLERYITCTEAFNERMGKSVVEVRSNRMPDGGIVVTYTDITPAVQAAEALERANETLERRVHERTEELTRLNQELGRAKAAADRANLSKTRFLAAASHDILQPLNAARLYATSLVERERGGEKSRLAGNVDASLEAVEEILAALLDISRLDTGSMHAEFSNIRIAEIFSQLEVEFTPIAQEKGLKLTFMPCSLTVRTDRRLLRRLLQNLVANAIKYTPRGRVLVGCRRLKNGRLRVDVIDSGIGIPEDKQTIIFQEFQRLDQGAQAARGLGLGLSIVERIGRVLNHEIGLRSSPGTGSTFSVTIPTAPAAIRVEAVRGSESRQAISLETVEVMCIENDTRVLEGMKTLLTGWGCRVTAAPGLAIAMRALKEGARPDVLLVDYHLDEGTGIEAVKVLRAKVNGELPAALVTAERSPQVRDEARAAEIQVLYKPLKPAMLRAFIAQWRIVGSAAE